MSSPLDLGLSTKNPLTSALGNFINDVKSLRNEISNNYSYTFSGFQPKDPVSIADAGYVPEIMNNKIFPDGKILSNDSTDGPNIYPPSSASATAPATPQQIVYYDAPYAEMYGMDAATAYQEALANTAYQRKVSDLKAAGLNPVLGISGSGAGSVYGASVADMSSGSSGGVSYGSSGSAKSGVGDQILRNLPLLIGATVTLGTKSYIKGSSAKQIAEAFTNVIRYS